MISSQPHSMADFDALHSVRSSVSAQKLVHVKLCRAFQRTGRMLPGEDKPHVRDTCQTIDLQSNLKLANLIESKICERSVYGAINGKNAG